MKRIEWRWLAISSLLLVITSWAEVRPRYGGTLHVSMHAAPASLDPMELARIDSASARSLTTQLFDTLVTTDDAGRSRPALAESWQSSRGDQVWEFRLRQGVKFHDGTSLTGDIAAASLRASNPSWKVSARENSLVIEEDAPDSEVPAELALPRNAIAKRDQQVMGTGPFVVREWRPQRMLTLAANEDYWQGRPFLDGVDIELGKSFRDQMTAFDLHKADLVEVAPEQLHHMMQEGNALSSSVKMELLALVFTSDVASPEGRALRQALGFSIERASIRSVLLQGAGEPSGGLLPGSISGYGFVFPTAIDLQKARQLRNEQHAVPSWSIGYDASDPLLRVLAERIALNAKDAGLSIRVTTTGECDLRIMRIPLASVDPWVALSELLVRVGSPPLKAKQGSVEELFAQEQAALASERVIPLFHLPIAYAAAPALKDAEISAEGTWDLERAWLETSGP